MKISETCTCGAKCEVEMSSSSAAAYYIKSWRQEHTHQVRQPYTYGIGGGYSTVTPVNVPSGEWTITNLSSEPPDATPQVA